MFIMGVAVRWRVCMEHSLSLLCVAGKDPQAHPQVGDERGTANSHHLRGIGPHCCVDQKGMEDMLFPMTQFNEARRVVYLAPVEFQCFYHVQILSNHLAILIALTSVAANDEKSIGR